MNSVLLDSDLNFESSAADFLLFLSNRSSLSRGKKLSSYYCTNKHKMSAIFSFESTIFVLLLSICTATYVRQYQPSMYHRDSTEFHKAFLYKCSVIGDRLSPYVSVMLLIMAFRVLFLQ